MWLTIASGPTSHEVVNMQAEPPEIILVRLMKKNHTLTSTYDSIYEGGDHHGSILYLLGIQTMDHVREILDFGLK